MTRPRTAGVVRGVLIALLVLLGAAGILLLATYPVVRSEQATYDALPRCAPGVSDSAACWSSRIATAVRTTQSYTALGARRNLLVLVDGGHQATLEVEPALPYACLAPGEALELKLWRGQVTGAYTLHGFLPTPANPNVGRTDQLEGGVMLLGIAMVVPLGATVARRRAARRRPESLTRLFERPLVRLAAIFFGIGQLADVVTSAVGHRAGLLEGNPVVADLVRVMGPVGFLILRVPIVALVLMGIVRLPRILVIGILVGCGLYFSAVGAHNLELAFAAGGPPPSCGPVTALP